MSKTYDPDYEARHDKVWDDISRQEELVPGLTMGEFLDMDSEMTEKLQEEAIANMWLNRLAPPAQTTFQDLLSEVDAANLAAAVAGDNIIKMVPTPEQQVELGAIRELLDRINTPLEGLVNTAGIHKAFSGIILQVDEAGEIMSGRFVQDEEAVRGHTYNVAIWFHPFKDKSECTSVCAGVIGPSQAKMLKWSSIVAKGDDVDGWKIPCTDMYDTPACANVINFPVTSTSQPA